MALVDDVSWCPRVLGLGVNKISGFWSLVCNELVYVRSYELDLVLILDFFPRLTRLFDKLSVSSKMIDLRG